MIPRIISCDILKKAQESAQNISREHMKDFIIWALYPKRYIIAELIISAENNILYDNPWENLQDFTCSLKLMRE